MNPPVVRHAQSIEAAQFIERAGRRMMPGRYIATLALSGVLGLLVITIGSITTGSRDALAVVGAIACAPAVVVVLVWGLRTPRPEDADSRENA